MDSADPCPQDPDPECKTIRVVGDRSSLPECSDGTRVEHIYDCPNYWAAQGSGYNGNAGGGGGGSGDRAGGGGGGGSSRGENKGVRLEFRNPEEKTRRYEPTAKAIAACIGQGHASFQSIGYQLEFRRIRHPKRGQVMGAADAETMTIYLNLAEVFRANGRGTGGRGWKLPAATTLVHEFLHLAYPQAKEGWVANETAKNSYDRLARRCAATN